MNREACGLILNYLFMDMLTRVDLSSHSSPLQLNLRNQVFFTWYPQENIQIINQRLAMRSILALQGNVAEVPPWYLVSPCVTDFSFGFQKTGKYKITVRVGYFDSAIFDEDPAGSPGYYIPNPEDVKNTEIGRAHV